MTASSSTPITLQECVSRLARDIGARAPSLVTLKRWSASGLLDAARIIPQGSARVKYNYGNVLLIARSKKGGNVTLSPQSTARSTPTKAVAGEQSDFDSRDMPVERFNAEIMTQMIRSAIADELKQVVAEALAAGQARIVDAVSNLDATRKSLMLRYDAEFHTLRDRVGELMTENARLRVNTSALDGERINAELRRMRERLDAILETGQKS